MKEQLKPLVHEDFHGLLNFPAADFDKMWMIKMIRGYGRLNWFFTRNDKGFKVKKVGLRSKDHGYRFEYFANQQVEGSRPCLIYYHGGGFVLPAFGYFKKILARYAFGADCDILFLDYTLSPEAKSKEILEQCEAAYKWVRDNATDNKIDKTRIAIGGDSAGGALAASMAQLLFDKYGKDAVCGQMLVYPAVDDRLETESIKKFYDSPVWSGKATEQMWPCYLAENKSYAVPMARENLEGLPQAYVETAEFDPLRDEGVAYAERLKEAGVKVVQNNTKKTVHGYDSMLDAEITQDSIGQRVVALKGFFAG